MLLAVLLIAYIAFVFLEVFVDLHFGDKHDKKSYLILTAKLLLMTALGLMQGYPWGIAYYLGLRLLLFDISIGYFLTGDPWFLGTTSAWDRGKRRFFDWIKQLFKKEKMKELIVKGFKILLPILAAFLVMHFVSLYFEAQGVESWIMGVITFVVVLIVMLIPYARRRW